jgi:hypothetical protein
MAAVAAAMVYGVASECVSAFIRPFDAELAAAVRPDDAAARIAQADKRVSEALTEGEIGEAMASATTALKIAPADSTSLRILAAANQLSGDEARARALMELAGQRNMRDADVQLWLFRDSLDARHYPEAFLRADLLLRRHPELSPTLYPALVANLDQPEARNTLLALMRRGPTWRSDFIRALAEGTDSGGIAPWLIANLAASPHPPIANEISSVASGLAARQQWDQVRDIWSRYGGKSDLLYDGDFDHPLRAAPFGWKFEDRDGALGSVEAMDGGANHGLYAQFLVGRSSQLAQVLLVLPPGRYRFSGKARVDELPSGGFFRWVLNCVQSPAPAFTVDQTARTGWRKFAVDFDVPQGCGAQWLRLGGTGGEGYRTASGWFDDLRLDPVTN